MCSLKVGVLALQGAFAKHIAMLKSLGVDTLEVRKPEELNQCNGLILPGGESTTIMRQINFIDFGDQLREFAKTHPLFGTCAGLIIMSKEIIAGKQEPFGILDVAVERNAFGRQVESFGVDLEIKLDPRNAKKFHAVFIRAPRIRRFSTNIEVLADFEGEPVLVQQGFHLGATFHPELSSDPAIHQYFLSLIKKSQSHTK